MTRYDHGVTLQTENGPGERRIVKVGRDGVNDGESVLIHRAFAGDSKAFGKIVGLYRQPVYNLCLRYLWDSDAQDAAQDTFLRAFLHRESFQRDRAVLPWLFTIARRLCIDRIRIRKREQVSVDGSLEAVDSNSDVEREISARQEIGMLAGFMDDLPDRHREAIALYHFDGLSYREMSDVMEAPIGTVMTWLHRGRAGLRKLMRGKIGDGERPAASSIGGKE